MVTTDAGCYAYTGTEMYTSFGADVMVWIIEIRG